MIDVGSLVRIPKKHGRETWIVKNIHLAAAVKDRKRASRALRFCDCATVFREQPACLDYVPVKWLEEVDG